MTIGDKPIETAMKLERTTPKTVVYVSATGDGPIRALYIQKDGMAEPFPARVLVTIEVTEV